LIAGLIVLGTLGLLGGSTNMRFDLTPLARGILWFAAAFMAAHIARRMLLALDTSSLCAAAVVMTMIAIGIQHQQADREIEVTILVQIGLTLAGALSGALSARRPARVRLVFAVLGSGTAGFGASLLGVGIASLVELRHIATGFFIAAPMGAMLVTLFVAEVEALHTALGQALLYAVFLAVIGLGKGSADSGDLVMAAILAGVGAILGFLLGAAGGAFGVRLRGEPKAAHDLPEARQVH
jgi:hypothetical protein